MEREQPTIDPMSQSVPSASVSYAPGPASEAQTRTDMTPARASSPADEARLTAAPVVSIGMPVYNGERFLRQSLGCLLAQDFRDFEIVISDNASTDATEAICKEFVAADPRVRYFRSDRNLGAAWNYNRVFALSRGRYFRWAAADDLVAKDSLRLCLARLRGDPGCVLAFPRTEIVDDEGNSIETYQDGLDIQDTSPARRIGILLRKTRECNAVFGLIDSNALSTTMRIGHYVGSDHILLAELALRGRFAEVADTIFYRRCHPAASSYDKSIARQREFYDPQQLVPDFERICKHKTWHQFKQSWSAVRRAGLHFRDRVRCYLTIARVAIESRRHLWREFRGTKTPPTGKAGGR